MTFYLVPPGDMLKLPVWSRTSEKDFHAQSVGPEFVMYMGRVSKVKESAECGKTRIVSWSRPLMTGTLNSPMHLVKPGVPFSYPKLLTPTQVDGRGVLLAHGNRTPSWKEPEVGGSQEPTHVRQLWLQCVFFSTLSFGLYDTYNDFKVYPANLLPVYKWVAFGTGWVWVLDLEEFCEAIRIRGKHRHVFRANIRDNQQMQVSHILHVVAHRHYYLNGKLDNQKVYVVSLSHSSGDVSQKWGIFLLPKQGELEAPLERLHRTTSVSPTTLPTSSGAALP